MKCIVNTDLKAKASVLRVSDQEAKQMVESGAWKYVPKWVWKSTKPQDRGTTKALKREM